MRLLVVGAGGHAKVVIDAALLIGHEISGVVGVVSDPPSVLGHPVAKSRDGISADAFVIAIGDDRIRARHFAEYSETGMEPARIVHPSVIIGSGVEMGEGTFVAAGVIINTGARIGNDVILNTGCVVDHDVVVGDHVHVGPGVNLCGAAHIGEGTLLGVGASVVPLASVGAWSVVGAGAAVTGDLPADSVCVGVPARRIRAVAEAPDA